jgi:hypothetical protein
MRNLALFSFPTEMPTVFLDRAGTLLATSDSSSGISCGSSEANRASSSTGSREFSAGRNLRWSQHTARTARSALFSRLDE